MPELPEVETVRRDLAVALRKRRIESVELPFPGSLRGAGRNGFVRQLTGARFAGARRRGKFLILGLDSGQSLVVHLKMTGVLQHQKADDSLPKAARIIFYFRDGTRLVFSDQRKFGTVRLCGRPEQLPDIGALGPEPLTRSFTPLALGARLAGRRAPVKAALLDQTVVAGLGNIYTSEALHRAGILPQRPAGKLSIAEVERLHRSIRSVLEAAIKARGSSVNTYRDGRGERGWFQTAHRVYDRQGRRCRRCRGTIVKGRLRGRGTYWCPKCQK